MMAYSRPGHLSQVLDSIKCQGLTKFSIYIDGADDRYIREKQEEIVDIVESVDWAHIDLVRRPINLGLRRSIVSAVEQELKDNDAVILIEDDCKPISGFFDFMFQSLEKYIFNKRIKSICGYQFPHLSKSERIIHGKCSSRFIPWGWATWKDRWNDYDTDLRHLVEISQEKGLYPNYPRDVKQYLDSEISLDYGNDIWSINWILAHFISDSYCLLPTRSLVENIGFDGTGVHCFETNAFTDKKNKPLLDTKIQISEYPEYDEELDSAIVNYMEEHWNKTMLSDACSSFSGENSSVIEMSEVGSTVNDVISNTPIIDIHTHLFPESFTQFSLSGIEDLLTYHYLMVEALSITGMDPEIYFSMEKKQQAKFVWDNLFVLRTPISEAAKGIVTILNDLNVEFEKNSFDELLRNYYSLNITHEEILDKLNIKKIVMTNDPFDYNEWILFNDEQWDRDLYCSAIRLDRLFFEKEESIRYINKALNREVSHEFHEGLINDFLNFIAKGSNPCYVAISIDGESLFALEEDEIFNEIAYWCEINSIPFALMIGVKRSVNPSYHTGGDGIGSDGLSSLEAILKKNPHVNFLVTHLLDNAQQALTVLARKLPNLKIFGHWWFNNIPVLVRPSLKLRLDLLGVNFIAQHSDARVFEQLIFKWGHFLKILEEVMIERYQDLINVGWPLTKSDIEADIGLLLNGNASKLIGVKVK
ncbi:hypothetical protein [Pseudoalteromonas sp.]|uniref:hypothetical protein n=1 Tax=Pseudoalteromonas sp. TaxID=53249 RepID=UPI002610F5A8|nr:hypothetical protein [Pseudoalteromonas sp.]MCP4588764.1 hypothetical protein [Pseudoalteromonas sp.]